MSTFTDSADVVIVGGGIAGSALALSLARNGVSVTVLEQQVTYQDRVRGEFLAPWGVKEAKLLGISNALLSAEGVFASRALHYDEVLPPEIGEAGATDVSQLIAGVPGPYCASHPATCEALSAAAEAAGARYVYGTSNVRVTAGNRPSVVYGISGVVHELSSRLVVAADGRASSVRSQVGIPLHTEPERNLVAGLLVDGVAWPQDAFTLGTEGEVMFFAFPQGGRRARLYTCISPDRRGRYAGSAGVERFLGDFHRLKCLPQAADLASGTPVGPCATYSGENTWTDAPLVDGVVLIGDAGGYTNPIVGQGLSNALRDARIVSELIIDGSPCSVEDFAPYAEDRRIRGERVRFSADLHVEVYMTFGVEGAARRARIYERIANPEDPAGMLVAPIMIGAHNAPDWAFTPEFRADLLNCA